MNNFFNEEDLKKASLNVKELDGMRVTLKCVENENVRMLCAIEKNEKIYVLRVDQIEQNK